ncbi:TRAP transporter, DctM subunit [Tistlia consotensis]|uniref:TRAP transporter large permease protein n=1 Tax=Tistlia consotensis USBA 355 TaxID=560819 RepID=A0A1Y6CKE3_9PROT|nr:TRAP transporter large permease [Tistlia consotensis]SMF68674.1 TRAP transporter, DctM subunit [Tistlia consotensis USBA 355]SNS01192.1 TRAP transporter, DctM subunit [Tistlia consotensis]
MDPQLLALLVLGGASLLLVLRVPIAYCLGLAACLGLLLFFSWRPGGDPDFARGLVPTLSILGSTTFGFVHNFELSMIPLFIGLGHVAYQARITTDLFDALQVWTARLPGGLAIASVLGCGGFSAITGSSVACASAMGRIAVPEMLRHGYKPTLATGSVAAGGTLGSLIPPSLLFVIYAIFTDQSVKNLFLAGILPGALSLAGYVATIVVWAKLQPSVAPRPALAFTAAERRAALGKLWPVGLLLLVIVGGIYLGVFTPTEAAAVSLSVAILIGLARRHLTWTGMAEALSVTVRQTAMIFVIAMGAKLFVSFISLTRVTPAALEWLQGTGADPALVVLGIVVFYVVIGMFLDSIGILVLTLPFMVPLVEGYGFDLVWFGVVVVKLLEIGLITPPIGLNVFVIKACTPDNVGLEQIFRGVALFLLLDLVVLAAILLIPGLSLWIPAMAL